MAAHQSLEETWGIAATHAEHRVGDYVRYSIEGQERSGTIVWICAPIDEEGQQSSVRYVVQPEDSAQRCDVILPGNVLIADGSASTRLDTAELEEALIEMMATLSIPIIINMEIDDSGQPFYTWHIGESTPQQPWGLYLGMDRHLIGAMKLALEKLIKHMGPA